MMMADDQERRELAVLSYHKIGRPSRGGQPSSFYVSEENFRTHMQLLDKYGWKVIDVQTFLLGLDDAQRLPQRAALITFDDGYRSSLTVATPVLEQFGYPSVIFVPTSFIGGTNSFDDGVEPEEPICCWAELLELERRGVSVQSHGVSHRAFSSLAEAELLAELQESAAVLEEGLGRRTYLFSYPFGDVGADPHTTKVLVCHAGYQAAFLSDGGTNSAPWTDRYGLLRISVGAETDLAQLLNQVTRR
jgi:peptidoglycan/xylan/chitin deacetylase (PgdA/CDA1 family)